MTSKSSRLLDRMIRGRGGPDERVRIAGVAANFPEPFRTLITKEVTDE